MTDITAVWPFKDGFFNYSLVKIITGLLKLFFWQIKSAFWVFYVPFIELFVVFVALGLSILVFTNHEGITSLSFVVYSCFI